MHERAIPGVEELCTELTSYPGGAVALLVLQLEPVPELEQLHGLFPFHTPCCCRDTVKPAVPEW